MFEKQFLQDLFDYLSNKKLTLDTLKAGLEQAQAKLSSKNAIELAEKLHQFDPIKHAGEFPFNLFDGVPETKLFKVRLTLALGNKIDYQTDGFDFDDVEANLPDSVEGIFDGFNILFPASLNLRTFEVDTGNFKDDSLLEGIFHLKLKINGTLKPISLELDYDVSKSKFLVNKRGMVLLKDQLTQGFPYCKSEYLKRT